jgi:hypothetical protein
MGLVCGLGLQSTKSKDPQRYGNYTVGAAANKQKEKVC